MQLHTLTTPVDQFVGFDDVRGDELPVVVSQRRGSGCSITWTLSSEIS